MIHTWHFFTECHKCFTKADIFKLTLNSEFRHLEIFFFGPFTQNLAEIDSHSSNLHPYLHKQALGAQINKKSEEFKMCWIFSKYYSD